VSRSRAAFSVAACAALVFGCAAHSSSGNAQPESAAGAPPESSEQSPAARKRADEAGSVFISQIPARVSEQARHLAAGTSSDDAFARALRVRIHVMQAYKDLGELSRRTKEPLVNGTFLISDLSRIASSDVPSRQNQKASFVIDYEEEAFAEPVKELERSGKQPTAESISAFASAYIKEKTYARSFDIASKVAVTRAGDCTEHAVFTTALLRRFGFKARVVFGIVLVGIAGPGIDEELSAFGHAWVEVYEDRRWRVIDAALRPAASSGADRVGVPGLPEGARARIAYLPINVIKDESMGYQRALMNEVGVESVLRLEVDVASVKRTD
jgi:hypothetical protein